MKNKFAALWPATTPRLQAGIAIFSLLGSAAALGTGAWAIAAGTIGLWQLVAAAGFALAGHGLINLVAKSDVMEKELRSVGKPAPAAVQKIADDLFAKAGLDEKYKPVVLITRAPASAADAGWLKRLWNRKIWTQYDNGAFIVPFPAGPKKDRIMIGVGHKALETLTRAELTAVLAHEAGHVINPSPNHVPLYSTASKLSAGLALSCLPFFNFAALPLALAGYGVTRLLMARGRKYDEERADRTSLGLYPHPDALGSALTKIRPLMIRALYPHGPTPMMVVDRIRGLLFGAHPQNATRLRYSRAYAAESAAFHADNALPVEPAHYNRASYVAPQHFFAAGPEMDETAPRGLHAGWRNAAAPVNENAPLATEETLPQRPRRGGPAGTV